MPIGDLLVPALGALLVVVAVALAIALRRLAASAEESPLDKALREELRLAREESARAARKARREAAESARALREEIAAAVGAVRGGVEERLMALQTSNERRLDEMRRIVDDKLHESLEKRLGESFRTVSAQLEAVHKGLGEMQTLAAGVGDLKKVLSNVKARGTWGEVQLGALLEQVLAPEQFARNVATKAGSREIVEFAVRLPGRGDGDVVHLPIDAKFPQEDYARLVEAAEAGDADGVQRAGADLARALRKSAQDVRDKYLDPPRTTDFALLFLPTEGLYAEVLRHPGLGEELQRTYRVVVVGPTTLAATLSSLRMGFRTLAIEKRASEVWQVLAAVKTEFAKFDAALDTVRRQLETAGRSLEKTGARTRAIERRLRDVETLPEDRVAEALELEEEG